MNKCWLLFFLIFISCEKNIDFELNDTEDAVVIDASIENGIAPKVVLTKSFSYYTEIDPALLSGIFIHGADVFISNQITTHKLKEYAVDILPGYTVYYYGIDSSDLATAFVGELAQNYSLKVITGAKEYNAVTSIPALSTYPDSVWFVRAPLHPDTNRRVMYIRATDPPGLGNYNRYFTKKNSGLFLPGENSVFDDQVIDGVTYSVILPPGINRNDPPKADSNFFSKGDTVILKFTNIDRATYKFWSTWEFAYQGIGNPFAQPNTVIGNINNGALGAFCGYAAFYKECIVD